MPPNGCHLVCVCPCICTWGPQHSNPPFGSAWGHSLLPAAARRPNAQTTALPLDMNPPLSRVLREMLRARGCKAEPGAGSLWAKRPLQPGLAPRRRPPTRPTSHPAAPPLRPAPTRDLASACSAPSRPCPRAPMLPLPPAPRDPRACRPRRGPLPFPRLPSQHAGAGTGVRVAQPGKVPALHAVPVSLPRSCPRPLTGFGTQEEIGGSCR